MSMTIENIRTDFGLRLKRPDIIVVPGIFDSLSGLLAEQAGFEALFFSGSALSYSQLARPDLGLVTVTELAEAVARTADRVSVPIIADVDSGFGAAPHAARTMKALERAGASVVQIEDQVVVKPDFALSSRPLVTIQEMTNKIKAMLDARDSGATLLSARTDASHDSAQEAIERAVAYREAGADLIFAEGMTRTDDLMRLAQAVGQGTPMVYNASYPEADAVDAASLDRLGMRVVLFPGIAVQCAAAGMIEGLKNLKADPSLMGGAKSPLSGKSLNKILGRTAFLDAFETSD